MRRSTEVYVMLASPSDVAADRDTVADAIEETNRNIRESNLRFTQLSWNSDVVPGIGTYPQNVVNNQLLDKYDIMIAIFGARLGSQTPVAPSGTVEEVRHALANSSNPFGSHRLLVFFKRATINSLDCDPDQLIALHAFRKELQSSNVFYSEYSTPDELGRAVRQALHRISVIVHNEPNDSAQIRINKASEEESSISEDLGLLDYQQVTITRLTDAGEHLGAIATLLNDFTSTSNNYSQRLISLGDNHSVDVKKKEINQYSAKMQSFALELKSEVQLARTYTNEALDAMLSAVNIVLNDFSDQESDLSPLLSQLEQLEESLSSGNDQFLGFRETIKSLPRMTKALNTAKRDLLIALDELNQFVLDTSQRLYSVKSRLVRAS